MSTPSEFEDMLNVVFPLSLWKRYECYKLEYIDKIFMQEILIPKTYVLGILVHWNIRKYFDISSAPEFENKHRRQTKEQRLFSRCFQMKVSRRRFSRK